MKHWFLVMVMALPLLRADEKKSPPPTKNKFTPKQIADLFADDIGTWKVTGESHLRGVDANTGLPRKPVEESGIWIIQWKVKGKSIEVFFTAKINNKDVPYVGLKEYDAKQGVFIWRLKGEGFPEGVSREIYDVKTRTFHGKSVHPDGAKEESTFQIINRNKRLFATQVKKDGKVVFTRKATFTRFSQDQSDGGN
tara:strand:+ start:768 stop:1352 length:585 start_codon:yes stop_codon:yes gene_type:complete